MAMVKGRVVRVRKERREVELRGVRCIVVGGWRLRWGLRLGLNGIDGRMWMEN